MEHQACPVVGSFLDPVVAGSHTVVGGSHDPSHLRDRRSPGSLKRACLQWFTGPRRLIGSRILETFDRLRWDGHETAP